MVTNTIITQINIYVQHIFLSCNKIYYGKYNLMLCIIALRVIVRINLKNMVYYLKVDSLVAY